MLCALQQTEATVEERISVHAMEVYYSHVHKVTSKGCADYLHCNYFQAGKIEKTLSYPYLEKWILLACIEMLVSISH